MRLGAIFIALCIAVIAGSAGAIVYLYLGVSTLEAATLALATFVALVLYNTLSSRLGLRSVVGRQLADLSRGGADVARQVAEIGRRLAAVEGKIETVTDHARAVTDPLTVEIVELGTRVKLLADTVEVHQTMLGALAQAKPRAEPAVSGEPFAGAGKIGQPARASDRGEENGIAAAEETSLDVAAIRSAIEANRIDLYLQPIVTLPQRKVRYYEAMSRLRSEAGEILHASAFIPLAESGGLMPKVDNLVAFRCVQLVRRLLLKNHEIGMFCNLSAKTLTDAIFLPQLLEFLAANRAIAPSLVLQLKQGAVAAMGATEHEGLAALSERGFCFSLDQVVDLRLDPSELANRGFRFVKVHADVLLKTPLRGLSDIQPADLADLLGRHGIELIVDRIENEKSVIDLLDHDVRYGQGSLFSPPRPVRPEALQPAPDPPDAVPLTRSAEGNPLAPASPAAPPASPPTENAEPGTVTHIGTGIAARG